MTAAGRRKWGTYQTGLRFADGRRKPAWAAYRLGLDAPDRVPIGGQLRLWGFVRGAANGDPVRVAVDYAPPGTFAFEQLGEPIQVYDPRGYFEWVVPLPRTGTYRLRWGGGVSNPVPVYVE